VFFVLGIGFENAYHDSSIRHINFRDGRVRLLDSFARYSLIPRLARNAFSFCELSASVSGADPANVTGSQSMLDEATPRARSCRCTWCAKNGEAHGWLHFKFWRWLNGHFRAGRKPSSLRLVCRTGQAQLPSRSSCDATAER
jgi:hypothetical protein